MAETDVQPAKASWMKRHVLGLTLPSVCVATVAYANMQFTAGNEVWFARLIKPSFMPSGQIFAYTWIGLYVLLAISATLVAVSDRPRGRALWAYAVNGVFNALWCYLFFYKHMPGSALFEIVLMWVSVYVVLLASYEINKTAAWLQVPYLLWTTFIAVLNYFVVMLN